MLDHFALTQSSAPSVEPVSETQLKNWLRLDDDDDGTDLLDLIKESREKAELFLGRQLITATWVLKLDEWPCEREIIVPRPPLQSVSSITYLDTNGTSQTLATTQYDVDTSSHPGRITEGYGDAWPATYGVPNAVTVTYVAGYGASGTSVPPIIKRAILTRAALLYEKRVPEKSIEDAFELMLWPHRIAEFM